MPSSTKSVETHPKSNTGVFFYQLTKFLNDLVIILWNRVILECTSWKIYFITGLTNTNPMFNNHMVSDLLLSVRRYNFFSTASLNA